MATVPINSYTSPQEFIRDMVISDLNTINGLDAEYPKWPTDYGETPRAIVSTPVDRKIDGDALGDIQTRELHIRVEIRHQVYPDALDEIDLWGRAVEEEIGEDPGLDVGGVPIVAGMEPIDSTVEIDETLTKPAARKVIVFRCYYRINWKDQSEFIGWQ